MYRSAATAGGRTGPPSTLLMASGSRLLFWVVAFGLACIVALGLASPLLRTGAFEAPSRADHDFEIYQAQFGEIDADLRRGTIGAGEAEIARAEIGRRLLKAASVRAAPFSSGRRIPLAAAAVVVLVPLGALLLYGRLGAPTTPDRPLASRAGESGSDLPMMIAAVERRLAEDPSDGAGWNVLAPIYLRFDQPEKAVNAYRRAIALLGAAPDREAGLGEALTQVAGGEVTGEAERLFRRVRAAEPGSVPAAFFLALNLSQEKRYAEAAPAWRALISRSPADAPWLPTAQAALSEAAARLRSAPTAADTPRRSAEAQPLPGPDAQDVAAAAALSAGDRRAMIDGMVSQLAERLKTAPNDVEGWKRLIRSYSVLGDGRSAAEALRTARASFPEGSKERSAITALADDLGLSASDTP